MGADLLFSTLPKFDPTPTRIAELKTLARQATWPGDTFEIESSWRTTLIHALDELPDLDGRRDIVEISLPTSDGRESLTHWLTAGMTYGDSPTESFDVLYNLQTCGEVMSAMLAFAATDQRDSPAIRAIKAIINARDSAALSDDPAYAAIDAEINAARETLTNLD